MKTRLLIPSLVALFLVASTALALEPKEITDKKVGDRELKLHVSYPPQAHIAKSTPPTLLFYGTDDKLKQHGAQFREAATGLNVRVEEFFAEGQGHGFFNREPWKTRTTAAADEFLASLGFVAAQQSSDNETDGSEAREPQRQRRQAGSQEVSRLLEQWLRRDQDKDGKVTIEETQGLMKANFRRNDLDEDGFIDKQEMKTLARRLARGRGGDQNRQNARNNRQQTVTTAALLSQVPDGVKVVPDIAYREGNPEWQLDLAMPATDSDQSRPAIVFIHGGGWRNGDKRAGAFMNPMLTYRT